MAKKKKKRAQGDAGRARQAEVEQIDPDELMGDINKLSFLGTTGISLLIHVLLIGGTSVGFIMLCAEYNTLHPEAEIRAQAEAQRLEDRAKTLAEQRAKYAAGRKPKDPKSAGGDGQSGKTPVERSTTRRATTLPSGTGVGLDDVKLD